LGKVILQVSIAVFLGAVDKFFGQRWLSPLEKIGPYAYEPEVFLVKNVMFGNNFVIFCGISAGSTTTGYASHSTLPVVLIH